MDGKEQFIKFIIKNIVQGVEYDAEKDKFTISHLDISDELISKIVLEGKKYNLTETDTKELLSHVSADIMVTPSVHISYSNTNINDLKDKQHLQLNFIDEKFGLLFVEMLTLQEGRFLVLDTNISGVCTLDELVSVNKVWNISYSIDFVIYRAGKIYPNKKSILRLNKLQSINYINPSVVHEIFDSQKCFTKEEIKEDRDKKITNQDGRELVKYVWTPKRHAPIIFSLHSNECDKKQEATFSVTNYTSGTEAQISINPMFVLPKDVYQRKYILDTIAECCEVMPLKKNTVFPTIFKKIVTIKEGLLKKQHAAEMEDAWVLEKKPLIKIIL